MDSSPSNQAKIVYSPNKKTLLIKGNFVTGCHQEKLEEALTLVNHHFNIHSFLKIYISIIDLESTTLRFLFGLFKNLESIDQKDICSRVFWIHEEHNEVIRDIGLRFRELHNLDLNVMSQDN